MGAIASQHLIYCSTVYNIPQRSEKEHLLSIALQCVNVFVQRCKSHTHIPYKRSLVSFTSLLVVVTIANNI